MASRKWKMKARGTAGDELLRQRAAKQLPPYTAPHKYLPLVRGVPMRDINRPLDAESNLPPMSLPIEAQNSLAYHLEMVGLVHIIDLKNMANEEGYIHVDQLPKAYLKHVKPEAGPDIQLNPGTWVPAAAITEQEETENRVSATLSTIEVPANLEDATVDQLQAIERAAKTARMAKLVEQGVDAHVKAITEQDPDESGGDDVDIT